MTSPIRQSYRRIIRTDTCHPLTGGESQERATTRNEVGNIKRGVDAYYAENPELKQSWKQTRHAIARNPTRRYP